ncbi:hypothetical protein KJ780_00235 [Candidatus Micrarchaeota archaeon]|nr:hypothetical protein [Candidatus Micrarchaeota archaeon]
MNTQKPVKPPPLPNTPRRFGRRGFIVATAAGAGAALVGPSLLSPAIRLASEFSSPLFEGIRPSDEDAESFKIRLASWKEAKKYTETMLDKGVFFKCPLSDVPELSVLNQNPVGNSILDNLLKRNEWAFFMSKKPEYTALAVVNLQVPDLDTGFMAIGIPPYLDLSRLSLDVIPMPDDDQRSIVFITSRDSITFIFSDPAGRLMSRTMDISDTEFAKTPTHYFSYEPIEKLDTNILNVFSSEARLFAGHKIRLDLIMLMELFLHAPSESPRQDAQDIDLGKIQSV